MGILDHLSCLLRNLYAEATVRTRHGTTDGIQTGKGVPQGCILSPCLFTLYAEYIMQNAGLNEAQAGVKITRRNINKLRRAVDTTLMTLTFSFPTFEPIRRSMSNSTCCLLTCTQVLQEAGKVIWYSQLFKNFPQFVVIHTVRGFNVVLEAEVDVFLRFSSFFYDPLDVGNLTSGSSAFSKSSLDIWNFS